MSQSRIAECDGRKEQKNGRDSAVLLVEHRERDVAGRRFADHWTMELPVVVVTTTTRVAVQTRGSINPACSVFLDHGETHKLCPIRCSGVSFFLGDSKLLSSKMGSDSFAVDHWNA